MIWIDTLLVIDTLLFSTKKRTLFSRLSLSEPTITLFCWIDPAWTQTESIRSGKKSIRCRIEFGVTKTDRDPNQTELFRGV
jgi:hypothetical protein